MRALQKLCCCQALDPNHEGAHHHPVSHDDDTFLGALPVQRVKNSVYPAGTTGQSTRHWAGLLRFADALKSILIYINASGTMPRKEEGGVADF